MINRFYPDLANARMAELEHEAYEARLARRGGVQTKGRFLYSPGLARRLVAPLRWFVSLHRLGYRASNELSLDPPRCEVDPVDNRDYPEGHVADGASHLAGRHDLQSTRDDSTLRFEESQRHHIEIVKIGDQMILPVDALASTDQRLEEEQHAVQCVAQHGCQVR